MAGFPWVQAGAMGLDILLDDRRAGDEAGVLRFNAQQLEQQARELLAQGQLAANELRVAGEREQGETVAAVGASGIALSGSPLAALADQAIQSEKGARAANFAAISEARRLRQAADNARVAARARERGTVVDIFERNVIEPIKSLF